MNIYRLQRVDVFQNNTQICEVKFTMRSSVVMSCATLTDKHIQMSIQTDTNHQMN